MLHIKMLYGHFTRMISFISLSVSSVSLKQSHLNIPVNHHCSLRRRQSIQACPNDSIGCMHRSESCISMPCWYISVSVDSRRPTWPTICSQLLNFQVDDAYGHHRHRHWLYHGHAVEPLATARFRLQQQGPGTVCRRKWRHHDHSHLLNLNLKHIYLNFPSLIVDSVKWLRCFCTIHLKLYIISYHRQNRDGTFSQYQLRCELARPGEAAAGRPVGCRLSLKFSLQNKGTWHWRSLVIVTTVINPEFEDNSLQSF